MLTKVKKQNLLKAARVVTDNREMENIEFEEIYNRLRTDIHETLDDIVEEKMQALHKRIRELELEKEELKGLNTMNERIIRSLSTNNNKLKFEILTLQDIVDKLKDTGKGDDGKKRERRKHSSMTSSKIRNNVTGQHSPEDLFQSPNNSVNNGENEKDQNTLKTRRRSVSFFGFSSPKTGSEKPDITDYGHTILSRSGTIRGFQNTVKNKISSYKLISDASQLSLHVQKVVEAERPNEDIGFLGKLILYTTSSATETDILNECKKILGLLSYIKIKFEERDICINPDYESELKERLQKGEAKPPYVFLRGSPLGDGKNLMELHKEGILEELLKDFKMESIPECVQCGGKRFTLCLWCQGSKKGLLNNYGYLKCTVCNKNGLQACFECNKEP